MCVDFQRNLQRCVAHEILGSFHVYACVIEHGAVGMAQIIWVNCRHFLPAINDVLSYTFCIRVAPVEDVFEVVHKRQPVLSVGVFCDRASACAFAYKIIVGSSVLQNCFKRWNGSISSDNSRNVCNCYRKS